MYISFHFVAGTLVIIKSPPYQNFPWTILMSLISITIGMLSNQMTYFNVKSDLHTSIYLPGFENLASMLLRFSKICKQKVLKLNFSLFADAIALTGVQFHHFVSFFSEQKRRRSNLSSRIQPWPKCKHRYWNLIKGHDNTEIWVFLQK